MLALRVRSLARVAAVRVQSTVASASGKKDLSAEIQQAIKVAQESKKSSFVQVRELLNQLKGPAPTAEELKARRQAARERSLQLPQKPTPLQGPRRPYKLRPVIDPTNFPWPAPHPNWYLYPTQKVFRSVLKKRENNGPLTYPAYQPPRLRESAPRSHLLSEQHLIREALSSPTPPRTKQGLLKKE